LGTQTLFSSFEICWCKEIVFFFWTCSFLARKKWDNLKGQNSEFCWRSHKSFTEVTKTFRKRSYFLGRQKKIDVINVDAKGGEEGNRLLL
jgi:hypothetical protein